jgi:HPt (histidine-containing phosphotransfer) domain-containing protein
MTTMPPTSSATIADAMARLWTKFLPEIERRLGVLEAAVESLEAGSLSAEQREVAHSDAHKLAGSLGTFGLQRGTEVAREAELMLAAEQDSPSALELASLVSELRSLIDSKK